MIKKRKDLLITALVGLVINALVVLVSKRRDYEWIHCLCDGFFVSGGLLLCVGGLKFCRNGGTFDMMAYGINSMLKITFPWARSNSPLERKDEDFADYKERKAKKRKPAKNLVLVGLVYLAIAGILMAVYSYV